MDLLNNINNNSIPTSTANNSNKNLMATRKASFSQKTFFLDNKNPPQLNAMLAEKIPKLGGKIDPFITKHTFCMVTNRPKTEWIQPQKMNGGIETDSPTPKLMLNVENSWSRGKLMLEKSGQTCKAMDTLELAKAFNIRIIKSAKLIKFIDSQLGIFNNLQRQQQNNNNNEYCIGYTRQLTPPYIKVVDNSFKYRPNYKELSEWPTLNFDYTPELCPFFKPKPIAEKVSNNNSNKNDINMRQSQQQQTNMNPSLLSQESLKTNTANTAGLKQYAMLTTPILTCTTTNTPQIQNNNKSINTTNQNKYNRKRNLIYCEICRKDYTDFEAHLQDEKHAQFLNNKDNFQELIGVINSLPPFFKEPIITDNSTMLFINNNQQSSATMIDDQKLSTFANFNGYQKHITSQSSPMTSLHSINAWSSASKNRSFVAIHDLLNEKNENCFNNIDINNSDENNANENNVSLSA